MAQQAIRILSKTFQPAAVGSTETKELFGVKQGDRVLCVSLRRDILAAAATTSTIEVGDGTDPDGYITAVDTESGAAGDLVDGEGALLAASGGKLYNAADTVDVVYTIGATPGATNPKVTVKVAIAREWPS